MPQAAPATKATQDFVPIREIRDGVVVLKDGGFRLVLMVSSMNFALKSEDEQTAILFQFQNFLNSLDFPIQMFVQSRRLDIRPYLQTLAERQVAQTNDLMRVQIREYIEFIKKFTEATEIMTKGFFAVVPYTPSVLQTRSGFLGKLWPQKNKTTTQEEVSFEEYRTQLEQRAGVVEQGFRRLGLRTVPLGTEELIEFYFRMFNPGENVPAATAASE